ncbi:response regulator [Candidatus Falkowbacteria bacterium]|nr:response regulator [Candidatus Falkowbacteria bacterium]
MSVTILIIDNEPSIVQIAKDILEREGFNVLTASGGKQGTDIWLSHRSIINLVVVDMEMPNVDGPAVISSILMIEPKAKILAMSGNPETRERCQAGLYLAKPFRPHDLIAAVNSLLK